MIFIPKKKLWYSSTKNEYLLAFYTNDIPVKDLRILSRSLDSLLVRNHNKYLDWFDYEDLF